MKTITIGFFAAALMLASCGGETETTANNDDSSKTAPPNADQAKVMKMAIDTKKSVVKWEGSMLGFYSHDGTLNFSSGSIETKGGDITGGGLQVDMSTMTPMDENYGEKNPKEGLVGHLSSPDFFDVANFPKASVVFKGNNQVALTIRNKTHVETYEDVKMTEKDGKRVYTASLTFDRMKYDVKFPGPAADKVISNDIELEIELHTK